MFDVGFIEILLLSTIGLLVLGPERLPHVARLVGAFIGKSKRTFHDLKHTMELEVQAKELKERLEAQAQKLQEEAHKTKAELSANLNDRHAKD